MRKEDKMTVCTKCKIEQAGGMSGQAFTAFKCEKCGEMNMHYNTNVPKICSKCSEKYNICERCGKPFTRKFNVDVIQKRIFSFEVDAVDENDAEQKAYEAYCEAIDKDNIEDYLIDEDVEYEID